MSEQANEGLTWFREEYERAKARNALIPEHARMVVTSPTLSAHQLLDADAGHLETSHTEWAIRCHTRDGELHTGRHFTTEREAIESGERLERINGADWWLVSRRRYVTVETSPWQNADRAHPPGATTS